MHIAKHTPLSSTELGTLWMTYQTKTMMLQIYTHFLEGAEDEEPARIMKYDRDKTAETVSKTREMFREAGAAIPQGFTEQDVKRGAPRLFDPVFEVMYLRMMSKVFTGLYALYNSMSYRSDIRQLYRRLTMESQEIYDRTTELLLEQGTLIHPPDVTMPREVEFVRDTSYMRGINPFGSKRSLNTVEVGHLYQAVETNLCGMQLMTGFAQGAAEPEVRMYFTKGKNLAKKIVQELSGVLMNSDVPAPAPWAGKATDATVSPFSDKLMMYNTSLLSNFGLGSNALGTAFSLRSDLPALMTSLSKDIFTYAVDGGKLMIKNNWMEEPPQMEDRKQLTRS
ncbi:DUF3231 family protein [Paenibacillus mucilaginosus]|uniref:DUF3231 family protein n=1 Tax=Paenibacillus mucilaginosus (strain KNP414) TaxID=1036673 RepID=F8FGD2_PAEMK|nr:DUF3231 family protein [Paenibacillus mucilaginosus]AEI44592.1 hypothetical protein KNP414_06068 [Paenibacillus mucilaginosus KNP414]MCG7215532.1 DUF3231 family protein [Paenibacillus mucilaginosus]WDM26163.1 DUF3231 family protein [Paenibacillus mucilaginosus]